MKQLFFFSSQTEVETVESARVKAVNLRKIPAQLGKARLTYFTFHLHWVNVT